MKGFIKIVSVNDDVHYINIAHIIRFVPAEQRNTRGNTVIIVSGPANTISVATNTTPDEVIDMIDLALS